jgi:hypothetical protein
VPDRKSKNLPRRRGDTEKTLDAELCMVTSFA